MKKEINRKNFILSIIKLLILAIVIIGVPTYIYIKYGDFIKSFKDVEAFTEYLKTFGTKSFIFIFIGQIIQTVVAVIPGQALEFASGYLFGSIYGILITILGISIGSIIAYYLAKLLGKESIKAFVDDDKLNKYYELLKRNNTKSIIFILYLIPGFPKDLINYVCGISNIKFSTFFLLSSIGRIPGIVGGVLVGSSIEGKSYILAIVLIVLMVLAVVIAYIYRDRLFNRMNGKNK